MKELLLVFLKDMIFLFLMYMIFRTVILDLKNFTEENKVKVIVCSQSDEGLICNEQ